MGAVENVRECRKAGRKLSRSRARRDRWRDNEVHSKGDRAGVSVQGTLGLSPYTCATYIVPVVR